MSSRICPRPGCKTKIESGEKNCPNCGAHVTDSHETSVDSSTQTSSASESNADQRSTPVVGRDAGYVEQNITDQSSHDMSMVDNSSQDTIDVKIDDSYYRKSTNIKSDESRKYVNKSKQSEKTTVKGGGVIIGPASGDVHIKKQESKVGYVALIAVVALLAVVAVVYIFQQSAGKKAVQVSQPSVPEMKPAATITHRESAAEPAEQPQQQTAMAKPLQTPAKPVHAPILGFELSCIYRPGGIGPFRALKNKSVMSSGDHYKIYFRPDKDGHAYIYQVDSAGHIFRLFPMVRFGGHVLNNINPVRKGKLYTLPSGDKSFVLDQNVGTEKIYVAISPTPNHELEILDEKLSQAQTTKNKRSIASAESDLKQHFRTRGVAKVVKDKPVKLSWNAELDAFASTASYIQSSGKNEMHIIELEHR